MLNLIRSKVFGSKFVLDIGKDMYHIVSYAFVDDTYILQNVPFECDMIEDVAKEI